jgi:predicted transport protein
MLVIDDIKYVPKAITDEEKELHPMIKKHFREIFGEKSLYFDVKHIMKTLSGIGSIPDAYAVKLSKPYEWYVVENELAGHPVYDHIIKQLSKFINGIENQNSVRQILDALYDEINKDNTSRMVIEKSVGSTDIYHFLSTLFSRSPRIVIIMDRKTSEVEEASRVFKYRTDVIEFKTFVREDMPNVCAHLIEPLPPVGESKSDRTEGFDTRTGRHYESWQKKLESINNELRDLLNELEKRVFELGNISSLEKTRKTYYKGKMQANACFAVLELATDCIIARIRANKTTFRDPQNWSIRGIRRGMFFSPQSKFVITSKDQIDYAMSLIRQAFEITEKSE